MGVETRDSEDNGAYSALVSSSLEHAGCWDLLSDPDLCTWKSARYAGGFTCRLGRTTGGSGLGVDRYVFFRADTDTDYYRTSRPITDILNRYTCLV